MQFALDLLVTLVSLFVVGQFAWAMRYHFKTDRMALAAKMISVIGIVTILLFSYLIFTRHQPAGALIAGVLTEAVGSLLFVSAIRASRQAELYYVFEGRRPQTLLRDGPYGYIRHPFYASYSLLWAGWGIATWSAVAVVPFAIIVAIYVKAALGEEAHIANSELAHAYADYKRSAGFFWPRII